MSLKFREELCTKTEEESTCRLKIDMRNLTNFDANTQKSPKYAI